MRLSGKNLSFESSRDISGVDAGEIRGNGVVVNIAKLDDVAVGVYGLFECGHDFGDFGLSADGFHSFFEHDIKLQIVVGMVVMSGGGVIRFLLEFTLEDRHGQRGLVVERLRWFRDVVKYGVRRTVLGAVS